MASGGVNLHSPVRECPLSAPVLRFSDARDTAPHRSNIARAIGTTRTLTQPRADVLVVVEDVVGVVRNLHISCSTSWMVVQHAGSPVARLRAVTAPPQMYMGAPAFHSCATLRMINAQSNAIDPGGNIVSSAK